MGGQDLLAAQKFMGDNGSMIAYTGLFMLKKRDGFSSEESKVRPG